MKRIFRILLSVRRMIYRNKLQSVLSLVGIAVGITAVIIIMSIGEGVKNVLLTQLETAGRNVLTIDAGLSSVGTGRTRQTVKVVSLKEKDASAITSLSSQVIAVAPTQEKTTAVRYSNASTIGRIIGTTPAYPSIRNFSLAAGSFFSEEENRQSARVIVIGQKCKQYLFPDENPLGASVRVGGIPFEVIGVLNGKGASYDGANEDDMNFIPLKTGIRRVFNVDYIKNIYVKIATQDAMPTAERDIRTLLRDRHRLNARQKPDDFIIQNVSTVIRASNETNQSFSVMMQGVAALSLMVGGVGILATMLLRVKERRGEIGLRMAVGAQRRDILLQFLSEAVILSVSGGLIGLVSGVAGTLLLQVLTTIAVRISSFAAGLSICISAFIGIFFGSYPALRASMVTPVESLHS